mgnify:FL=1
MAISLRALIRGANRGQAASLSGQTRGTQAREEREERRRAQEAEAMDRALMRSLEQQRFGLASRREEREGRENEARERRESEGMEALRSLREAEAGYYRRRPGSTQPGRTPEALAERVARIAEQRSRSGTDPTDALQEALLLVPGANTPEVRRLLIRESPLGTRVGSVQTGRAAPAPTPAATTRQGGYRAENPFR